MRLREWSRLSVKECTAACYDYAFSIVHYALIGLLADELLAVLDEDALGISVNT